MTRMRGRDGDVVRSGREAGAVRRAESVRPFTESRRRAAGVGWSGGESDCGDARRDCRRCRIAWCTLTPPVQTARSMPLRRLVRCSGRVYSIE